MQAQHQTEIKTIEFMMRQIAVEIRENEKKYEQLIARLMELRKLEVKNESN